MFRIWKICLSMIMGMLCFNEASSQSLDSRFNRQTSLNYSVNPNPTSTYQWFVVGGTFDGTSTGSSVNITWNIYAPYFKVGVLETSVHGCKGDTVWHRMENERVIFPYITGKRMVCVGEEVELKASSSDSIYKDIYYRWSNGATSQNISLTVFKKTSLFCVVYYNGDAIDTAFITIDVLPIPKPDFSWTPMFPKEGDEVVFRMKDQNYPFAFNWIVNGVANASTDKEFRLKMDSGGVHTIALNMYNELGCDAEKKYTLNVEHDYPFPIPEAFSPNGDGVNDELYIDLPEDLRSCELRIFNRWGTVVYQSNALDEIRWDGRYNGEILAEGAYIIQVVAYANNNKYLHQNGTVAILR
jgi:gliding motility-associated-like protein